MHLAIALRSAASLGRYERFNGASELLNAADDEVPNRLTARAEQEPTPSKVAVGVVEAGGIMVVQDQRASVWVGDSEFTGVVISTLAAYCELVN
jgi:hypothetical protein